jgi:hypothetical protein
MKFRVHTYQEVRVSYEVEAESAEAAQKLVSDDGWNMEPVGAPGPLGGDWSPFYIVDPLLPDGSVDYDNVVHINEEEDHG